MRIVDVGGFTISKSQKRLVNKVLKSTRLSYGPMTQEFEKQWSELHQVKHSLFCNSGTSALQVALHALKEQYLWKDHDEIIIPALTFVATMNIVLHNNMKPVFVDIEKDYFMIDPEKIEEKITNKTRAIIVVHLLGQPAQMDRIMEIANKYGLKVIEDSCETVGATYASTPVGTWGNVSCFSTYASHLVVTGVGGFTCTNDDELAIRIRGLYNHGRDGIYHSIDDNKKGVEIIKSRFNFTHSGYSYRCTELEAALGIGHMERFGKELKKRQKNAAYLIAQLNQLEQDGFIFLPKTHPLATHSWMLFPIVVNPEKVNRNILMENLEENGIKTRYMMPLLSQPITQQLFGGKVIKNYPIAQMMDKNAFLIGCHPEINKRDLDHVADILYKFCGYYYNK